MARREQMNRCTAGTDIGVIPYQRSTTQCSGEGCVGYRLSRRVEETASYKQCHLAEFVRNSPMDLKLFFADDDVFGVGIDETIIIGAITALVGEATALWAESYIDNTSSLSGLAWVDELMEGHPGRIKTALGVSLRIFKALLSTLRKIGFKDSKHVKLREQLAIFLYTCVTGLSIRHVGERFQRSNGTISKYVYYASCREDSNLLCTQ